MFSLRAKGCLAPEALLYTVRHFPVITAQNISSLLAFVALSSSNLTRKARLHNDAMKVGFSEIPIEEEQLVRFEPFVGVGPRHFLDLFSMRIGSGWALKREDEDSSAIDWSHEDAQLRIQMPDKSYLDNEVDASLMFEGKSKLREKRNGVRG